MSKALSTIALLVFISSHTTGSLAAITSWELRDVTLSNGDIVTGGFDFDDTAQQNMYSNVAIFGSGESWDTDDLFAQTARRLAGANSNSVAFRFYFFPDLDRLFGFPDVLIGQPISNLGGHLVTSGIVVRISPIPLPATVWLLGSALLGLGAAKRRKA